MSRVSAVVGVALALTAASPASAQGFCSMLWAPVCASKDGVEKTYSNAGCAKVDNADVVHDGECAPPPQPKPNAAP